MKKNMGNEYWLKMEKTVVEGEKGKVRDGEEIHLSEGRDKYVRIEEG